MRTVELTKVALSAEALRLRRIARRQAMRVAFGAGAAVFAIAVLVVLHYVLWFGLVMWLAPIWATVVVLVVDLVIAGILGAMAMSNTPDPVEIEAQQIKTQALAELKRSLTVMGMAAEVAGMAIRTRTRSGMRQGAARVAAELASRLVGR